MINQITLNLSKINNKSLEYDILNNNIVVGILIITIEHNYKCVFINKIIINQNERNKGYGTKTIHYLMSTYKGYTFTGDILYPIAAEFWIKFDKELINCDFNSPDLTFGFK